MAKIKTLTLNLPTGYPSFEAAWEALVQFVDNNEDETAQPAVAAKIKVAKTMISLFDEAYASMAD